MAITIPAGEMEVEDDELDSPVIILEYPETSPNRGPASGQDRPLDLIRLPTYGIETGTLLQSLVSAKLTPPFAVSPCATSKSAASMEDHSPKEVAERRMEETQRSTTWALPTSLTTPTLTQAERPAMATSASPTSSPAHQRKSTDERGRRNRGRAS